MRNELYPIFLKTDCINLLIVGGGYVALEKLTFLLKSSPHSNVSLVSIDYIPEVIDFIKRNDFKYVQREYASDDLEGIDVVIGATDDPVVNEQIYRDAKKQHVLVNIADNPPLCDFYMGGIVTKGNVKVAISTNGKSPTLAKRLRQFFEDAIPDNINVLAENLNTYRKSIKGDFGEKVSNLNQLTKSIISNQIQEK